VRLSARLYQRVEQALLGDAVAAARLDDPADLPGVSGVTSRGPGPSPAARVQPLFMTVGQVRRRALLAHPTSRIVLDPVRIPAGAQVKVVLGIDDRVQDRSGDGVTFRLLLLLSDGEELLLERHLDPRVRQSDGAWLTEEVDLGPLAGRQGSFVLETLPGPVGDTGHDWSAWAGLDLVMPLQRIPARWCRAEQGPPLDPDDIALELPAGGNITLRLAELPAAGTGMHLELVPLAPAAVR
jgi:hypothetical protein